MSYPLKPLRAALLFSSALLTTSLAYAQDNNTETEEAEERRLGPVVVRGAFVPDEKRQTSEIASLINAEDFQVTGDADAASALARVSGLSVSRGKFVFVRGLNERYTSSTLNGSVLPSPEPLRRVAPLDLFPTSVLDSVLVQKTWSPQFSAEFGGGLIELRTKKLPDQGFFDVSISGSARTDTNFQDGLLIEGGGFSDFLGFDDGIRFPDALADVFFSGPLPGDPAALASIAGQVASQELAVVQLGTVQPNFSVSLAGGQRWDVNQNLSLGFTSAFSYRQNWDTRIGTRTNLQVNGSLFNGEGAFALGLDEGDTFTRESTELSVRTSGLVTLGADLFDTHEVGVTLFGTRSTSRETRVFEGFQQDISNDIRNEIFEFFERQLFTVQVSSSHEFPVLGNLWSELDDFRIELRGSYSEALRDSPSETDITFEEDSSAPDNGIVDGGLFIENGEDFEFDFSFLDDTSRDFGVDLILPFTLGFLPDGNAEIRAGYNYLRSDRDTVVRLFNFDGGVPAAFETSRVDFIFTPENVLNGTFGIQEAGAADVFPDAFRGELEVNGFYVSGDVQITPFFRLAGGVRYEDSLQTSDAFDVTEAAGEGTIEASISEDFILPSVTATWNFADNLQLRAGFSQTITRPQFRELALQQFVNSETDESFQGNPFLINSQTDNYDARLEWYFGRDQFITLGGFYKQIEDPIEEIGLSAVDTRITGFINAPSAELYGFELEYQQEIPLDDWLGGFFNGRDYVIQGNYTFTQSSVSADGTVITTDETTGLPDEFAATSFIEDGRRLVGQSDHLVNFQIGWDDADAGSQVRLLLNFASDRIRSAENFVGNQPAVIEQPPLSLDFTYSKDIDFFGGLYTMGFGVTNITGDDFVATQTDDFGTTLPVDTFARGRTFSLRLKASY